MLGRLHPDEVYQSLEPAYRLVHGYGIRTWEWDEGIRNWAFPLLLAGILKVCDACGITDPRAYRAALGIPLWLLHACALLAAYRYAYRRAGAQSALLALLSVAFYGPVIMYAGRTLSESVSTAFLVMSVEALTRPVDRPRAWSSGIWGGAALGLAAVARYGSLAAAAGAFVWLLVARRLSTLVGAIVGFAMVAIALFVLDWISWGAPLHSVIAYAKYNVFSGESARAFGAHGVGFYGRELVRQVPVWFLVALPTCLRRAKWVPPLGLSMSLVYLGALALTPHKEERFLYSALVLCTVDLAPELWLLVRSLRKAWLSRVLGAGALITSFAPAFLQLDTGSDKFRAMVEATRPRDVTGLLIVNEDIWSGVWSAGGYFYIGKQIPWVVRDVRPGPLQLDPIDHRINRALTTRDRGLRQLTESGFFVIGRVGKATILARNTPPP
jgi:hypothetical protein